MAKFINYAQVGGTSLKKAVCEICGTQYDRMTSANACEASHFANFEIRIKGGRANDKEKRSDGTTGGC